MNISKPQQRNLTSRSIFVALVASLAAQGFALKAATVTNFWNNPDTYQTRVHPQMRTIGLYQVRLSIDGSKWLHNYEGKRRVGKTPPGQVPAPISPDEVRWENWLNAKISFDRANASVEARKKNVVEMGENLPNLEVPMDPGRPPIDLVEKFTEPPIFAEVVRPLTHVVTFEGKDFISLDNPVTRARFRYYRFNNGVMSMGTSFQSIPKAEINELLAEAKISVSQRKILSAVSLLEGGFDSINTYDTGFVSAGLIQFACLSGGAGSLGQVLLDQKKRDIKSFNNDFVRFGIDVKPNGRLLAMNLSTGVVSEGPSAAAEIINDPRLAAIFQRAGRESKANRVSQLRVAVDMYFPANDPILVFQNGVALRGKVSDVIKSEAGLAVLMDLKVNTGGLGKLSGHISNIISREKLTSIAQVNKFENELVRRMIYRKNYLLDKTLSQPAEITTLTKPIEPDFRIP